MELGRRQRHRIEDEAGDLHEFEGRGRVDVMHCEDSRIVFVFAVDGEVAARVIDIVVH